LASAEDLRARAHELRRDVDATVASLEKQLALEANREAAEQVAWRDAVNHRAGAHASRFSVERPPFRVVRRFAEPTLAGVLLVVAVSLWISDESTLASVSAVLSVLAAFLASAVRVWTHTVRLAGGLATKQLRRERRRIALWHSHDRLRDRRMMDSGSTSPSALVALAHAVEIAATHARNDLAGARRLATDARAAEIRAELDVLEMALDRLVSRMQRLGVYAETGADEPTSKSAALPQDIFGPAASPEVAEEGTRDGDGLL
jgi:hypothetical protein